MINLRSTAKFDTGASILLVEKEQTSKKIFINIRDIALKASISDLLKTKRFCADKNEIFPLIVNNKVILLVGVGKKSETSTTSLRVTVRSAMMSPFIKKIKDVELIPHSNADTVIRAIIEGIAIGSYSWKKYQTPQKNDEQIAEKNVYVVAPKKKLLEDVIAICDGVTYARDLVNDNADLVTADYFEKEIKALVKGRKGISLEVLGKNEMKKKGLNLHLAVNQGSNKEPKLIIIKYNGSPKKGDYTALIGKGITFDTGGINLKPSGHLESMRCDMSGAAALVGILKNILALGLKKNIIIACALAENAIGSCAYKPGDVIQSYNGKTVEIANTDAEGRLVLADAISYVAKNYKPARIIDIATLTGACVVALGYDYSGLISSNDAFARKLINASNQTDDKAWRLPSYPELKDAIKSEIADIKNTSNHKGAGGTITAAEFLRQFTENITWAHLDIAGTAFIEGKAHSYYAYGATGAGVRLLTEFLRNN